MVHTQLIPFSGKLIEVTVTDKAAIADNWVLEIQTTYNVKNIIVGLNCKWMPHPIVSMSKNIATLQLCVENKCLIIQLLHIDCIPQSIRSFLGDPNNIFVGVELEEVLLKLRNEYGLCCSKKIDIRLLAKIHFPLSFYGKPGLKSLASQIVELEKWKPQNVCLDKLELRILDEELVKFACLDAYASYRIGHKLHKDT